MTVPPDDADRAGYAADRAHALRTMFPRRVADVPDGPHTPAPAPDQHAPATGAPNAGALSAGAGRAGAGGAAAGGAAAGGAAAGGAAAGGAGEAGAAPVPEGRRRTPLLVGAALVVLAVAASAAVFLAARAAPLADRVGVVVPVTTVEVAAPPDAGPGSPAPAATSAPPSASPSATPAATGSASPGPSASGARPEPPSVKKTPPRPAGRANPSGANLALRRGVEVSGVEGDPWKASNAVDGDLGTRWSSAFTDPGWLTVDLGEAWAVSEVEVVWEHAYATAYRVEASTDGRTWTVLYRTTSGSGGTVTVREPAVARYVRLYATARNGQYGYSVLELRVR
ncbi:MULTISPECIES: discoidin domain-containing protein [Catenuloplanes]|uniref:F5/8 type C domain-containing protein n=1 Tax=Catenuloplanes niger TaxID=587534 RepID=A0AAE3ZYL2_9ACTN|nr:discoidin domain-containing protein [Catenuloplanes niger]MDR7326423.1 hypothetical protein [Catenuloplanes niger]